MKIVAYPADKSGCGYYRIRAPAAASDLDVTLQRHISAVRDGDTVVDVRPPDADVVLLQRPGTTDLLQAIPLLRQYGVRVVVDVDDAMWSMDPDSAAFWGWNPASPSPYSFQTLKRCCEVADQVVVTTPELRRQVGGVVVPNFIPRSRVVDEWDVERARVGWGGHIATHPHDLKAMRQAAGNVVDLFHVVGQPDSRLQQQVGVNVDASGPVPFDEWTIWLSRLLDVGVAPLTGSRFNRSKSALKMLEYAAAGVAPVGSKTWDNVRVADDGVGIVCDRRHEWVETLTALVEDDAYRAEVTAEARQTLEDQFLLEDNVWRFEEAWTGLK